MIVGMSKCTEKNGMASHKKNRVGKNAVQFGFSAFPSRDIYKLVVPIKILDCEYGTNVPVIVRRWLLKLGWMVA